jgi:aminoglycoside phosphotransferase (APT) family kinase protein
MTYGQYRGRPAIAKLTGPRDGPWRWYFDRELALYRAFAREPAPVRLAELYFADEREGVMVFEWPRGQCVCETRAARRSVGQERLEAILDSLEAFAALSVSDPRIPAIEPDPSVTKALRDRLLEDPSAPLAWIEEGLLASANKRLLPESIAARAAERLREHSVVRASHGDFLLRNVMALGGDEPRAIAWIDLECAGPHAQGWDLGLLWVNVVDEDRAAIERRVERWSDAAATRAWAACALFAIARERLYRTRSASRGPDERERAFERMVAALSERL